METKISHSESLSPTDLKRRFELENWIENLLQEGILTPDNIDDFKRNLLKGMIENDEEKLEMAYDELTQNQILMLKARQEAFKVSSTNDIENQVEAFLETHKESSNTILKQVMIENLQAGEEEPILSYIRNNLARKKIPQFEEFVQIFKITSQKTNKSVIDEERLIDIEDEKKMPSIEEEKIEIKHLTKSKLDNEESPSLSSISIEKEKSIIEPVIVKRGSLKTETRKSVWTIYETYEDASSEYKMEKIKFNQKECEDFLRSFKTDKCKIRGYYGDYKNCLSLTEQYLEMEISGAQDSSAFLSSAEGIIAFSNGEKACLLFVTKDDLEDFKKRADTNNLAITYIRTLVDICSLICIAPSSDFSFNPDDQSPYLDRPNPGFSMKEEILQPSDKVAMIEIPIVESRKDIAQKLDFSRFVFSPDFSKFLVKPEFKLVKQVEPVKHEVSCFDLLKSSAFGSRIEYKKFDYNQLKHEINTNFPHKEFSDERDPRKFEDRIKEWLSKFIENSKIQEFNSLVSLLQDEYLDKKKEKTTIFEKDLQDAFECAHALILNFFEKNNCQSFQQRKIEKARKKKEENNKKKDTSILTSIKNFIVGEKDELEAAKFKCLVKCKTYYWFQIEDKISHKKIDIRYLEKKYGNMKVNLHNKANQKLASVINESNQQFIETEETLKEKLKQELMSLRLELLGKLFEEVDKMVATEKYFNLFSVQMSFQCANIIRNAEHMAENFNITQAPFILSHRFNKDTQSEVKVKSLWFTQENSGLILFSNTPEFKSSIFYFNLSNKASPIIEPLMNLSSTESSLLIEPSLKLWCIYDNKEHRFNMGKLTSIGKIEEGSPLSVFNEIKDGQLIHKVRSACFLPFSDIIYIINQDYHLFELRYQSRQLNLVLKKENKGDSGVVKSKILPSKPSEEYSEIQTTSDGKNIILKSTTCLDIYDLSWTKLCSISLDNSFLSFKAFTDKINNFLLIFKLNEIICYQLIGLTATRTIKTEVTGVKELSSSGNPIFDYLYLSFQKFGPHSDYIGCPAETKLAFLSNGKFKMEEKALKYFKNLRISEVTLEVLENKEELSETKLYDKKTQSMNLHRLKMILFSRVPIHVATIENFTLVPLQDGKNISDQIADNICGDRGHDIIERLIELIRVDVYESFLRSTAKKIHIVSIVGRQSSGKSYVMNRVFGTRFNVASTRCTDGIWISMSEIQVSDEEWKLYVVLDCEGLFSARRNDQEETKLCLTLSAVSDVMILNQDLAFNRYLNQLFNNFSKGVGRLKGRKLFRGYLMMLIRDVKSEAAEGAYKELQANITQVTSQKNNFLSSLFQGNLKSQCLNYFEQSIFNSEINLLRQRYFLSLCENRWETGTDFLESFKLTLAQVFIDDDTDMDLYKLNITCDNEFQEALKMFYESQDKFTGEGSVCELEVTMDDKLFNIRMEQKDFIIYGKENGNMNELDEEVESSSNPAQELIVKFIEQTLDYRKEIHNSWVDKLSIFLETVVEQRIAYVLKYFESKLPCDPEFKDIVKSYCFKLKNILDTVLTKVKYCKKTCRRCARRCVKKFNHSNNCDCETLHICELPCKKTIECARSNNLCIMVFGHEEDHRCGEGNHKCGSPCEMAESGCAYSCSYEAGHPDTTSHNCQNKHPCNERCIDEKCTRNCQFDLTFKHTEHTCGDNKCVHKCSLCDKQCIFDHHLHDKLIKEGQEDLLQYEFEGKAYLLNYHTCGNEHACLAKCSQKGVCQIDYTIIEKEWKNEFGSFNYPYFEPKESRHQCNTLIPKFLLKHKDSHNCKIGVHRCFNQCPECKSFCNKEIDHEGHHSTNTHRNKEQNVFVSNKKNSKIEIKSEGKARIYAIGERCQPENCTTSCTRKGRAHYHLKECPGGDKCEAKVNPFVKHSTDKFYPYKDKIFDLWLCGNYWNSMNWESPVEDSIKEELCGCNYVCNHPSHKEEHSFCKKKAWHEDAIHEFDCKHEKGFSSNVLDVVFCCDSTGSMGSYIEKSKNTVKKVIATAKEFSKGEGKSVRFAFVSYRDHPPQDATYVTKMQDLCDETTITNFINGISAAGGGDGPEAVLDGLHDAINRVNYRKDSLRYLFHIADAPPHGKEYTSGVSDGFPSGCPCGVDINSLAASLKLKNIRYKLLKIGTYPNTMASIFKSKIEDYEEMDLDSAIQLDIKVTDILIRDIKNEEFDLLLKEESSKVKFLE